MSRAEVDESRRRLAQAAWLIGVVAKKMVENPDGTARLVLPARMVRSVKDFVADTERAS